MGMISRLRGNVLVKDFAGAVIDVHGIGFRVSMPMTSIEKLPPQGQEAEVFVHMAVREDAMDLFGFHNEAARKVFLKLISVNGIGPKMGLSFLSGMTPEDLVAAVIREDIRALCTIKGVGKKKAERLVLELKEPLKKLDISPGLGGSGEQGGGGAAFGGGIAEDLRSALVNLGYQETMADKAVEAVRNSSQEREFDTRLRAALKVLRKGF
mgnify:CR=1 FL=1